MIIKAWKNLRLQSQILIFQSIIAVLIFAILLTLCLYLVNIFSIYIKQELLQSLILKSMTSTIQISVIRLDRIGKFGYNQQMAQTQSLKNLYFFQEKYNIQMTQIEDCLQSPHSQQFYSYQFCYGLYGKIKNQQSDLTLIKNFISLQNQFITLYQTKQQKTLDNLYLDEQQFFSQYQGEYKQTIDQSIIDLVKFMQIKQQNDVVQQLLNQRGQVFLYLNNIPGTKIVLGSMYNQTQDLYYELTQSQKYFNQRQLSVMENGIIVTDTSNFYAFGMMFQNTSYSGFDEQQFQKIKNFSFKNQTVMNECQLQLQNNILCLQDINKTEKLIFCQFVKNQEIRIFVIVIVNAIFLHNIKQQFNDQLNFLIDEFILTIVLSQIIIFLICVMLQIAFIQKLNKPLYDLQDIVKSNMTYLQQNISRLIRVFKTQNQTQKLADSFFNLINLSHKTRLKEHIVKSNRNKEIKFYLGTLIQRRSQKIIKLINRKIELICHKKKNSNGIQFN